jgi:hypothetical protein
MICQKPVVDKHPTESIRNNDDNALDGPPIIGFADVGVQAMELDNFATRLALVNRALEAIWAGHVGSCKYFLVY